MGKGKGNGNGHTEVKGKVDINITDFDIDLPRALLGTIRTGKEIELIFDLTFERKE